MIVSIFCLGFLGLALSAIGIYGVIAYLASQRTREISVRMALGATARDVMGLVMSQGLRAVALGLVLGGAGVVAQARALSAITFGVSGRDPLTLAAASLTLLLAAALATALPAWRSTPAAIARRAKKSPAIITRTYNGCGPSPNSASFPLSKSGS